jgi:putative transposase
VTRKQDSAKARITAEDLKQMLWEDSDLLKTIVEQTVQQVLEAEMEEALQAGKGEHSEQRLGYRSGYYNRTLVTRVGKIELRVPQDRQGRFRTEVFERYQRSEKALVAAMLEMYVQGVSTRKVKSITEELCGHEFSSSSVSRIVKTLDEELEKFAQRRLEEPYPYLILDARYEKVREDGAVRSQAVLVAIGINWEGRRNVLAVELAHRESTSSGRELLVSLRQRSLQGVEFVVSDDHAGLRRAIQEVLPEAVWHASACYTTFQSSFILKAIALGQAQSAAVYGRCGLLAPGPAQLEASGFFYR